MRDPALRQAVKRAGEMMTMVVVVAVVVLAALICTCVFNVAPHPLLNIDV